MFPSCVFFSFPILFVYTDIVSNLVSHSINLLTDST